VNLRGLFGVTPAPRRLLGRLEAQDLALRRLPAVFLFLLAWAMAILLRLLWLQVVQHNYYHVKADSQHFTTMDIPAIRGELRDRRGISLAVSRKVESLFVQPRFFYPDYQSGRGEARQWGEPDRKAAQAMAARLAPYLDLSQANLLEKLLRPKPFVYLQRQLPPSKVEALKVLIKQQNLKGLHFLPESLRVYPMGSLACQLLGFTDIDGIGQLGIERTYQPQLAGKAGKLVAPQDANKQMLILEENYSQVPVNGSTLQLTLDASIQHIVEEALQEAVDKLNPLSAYAVVVDPGTGEILAMAGTPTFDPNHPLPRKFMNRSDSELSPAEREEKKRETERQKAARKVRPVEDTYEPGSTMKIFTAAIALEERKVHLGEQINCEGGKWHYADAIVTDTHRNGVLTFEEVLWHSSNVGAAKIGLRMDPAVHYQYLRKFGFGEQTGLNFPGESRGLFPTPDGWSRTTQLTLSYGYGMAATPLQILMAGCALANGGKLMQPLLIHKIYNDQGYLLQEYQPRVRAQVISEETSNLMKEVLKGVITQPGGTGRRAALDGGVEAFGKTGTSRKRVNGVYDARRHYSSFMGFFPADKPQYGVLFMIDEPGGGLTGGDVAAPLFKRVGDDIMRYRITGHVAEQEPNTALYLRDWPASEDDDARIHIETGKVPDLSGLPLKGAIYRVVLAGGIPRVEQTGTDAGPARVVSQSPAPGSPLPSDRVVWLKVGTP
jgi:cell division protein FtsI (penicillin-binding protein 3)